MLIRRGRRSGLFTIVAVHSTVRGPSLGGCRMWHYADTRAALRDALRLSQAMTFKSAVAAAAAPVVPVADALRHIAAVVPTVARDVPASTTRASLA